MQRTFAFKRTADRLSASNPPTQKFPQVRSFHRDATQRKEETQSAQRKRRKRERGEEGSPRSCSQLLFLTARNKVTSARWVATYSKLHKTVDPNNPFRNTLFLRRQQKKGAYTFALKCGTCVVNKTGALQFAPTNENVTLTKWETDKQQKQTEHAQLKKVAQHSLLFLAQWRYHSGLVKGPIYTSDKTKSLDSQTKSTSEKQK